MTRDEAREHIKSELENYLHTLGIDTKKAFTCLNPLHDDQHPSMSLDRSRNKAHCFSCGADYDTFDLIEIEYGLTGNDLFLKAYELFGVEIDKPGAKTQKTAKSAPAPAPVEHKEESEAPNQDLSTFFLEAHENIWQTTYPQKRGLSEEIINRFNLGYVDKWRHPKAPPTAPESPRLIIPTSPTSYFARDARTDIPEDQKQYAKSKVGPVTLFNAQALENAEKPIFITEGEIDALSIIEAGGEAMALGSTTNQMALIKALLQSRQNQTILLALDNDDAGERAAFSLLEKIAEAKMPVKCYKADTKALYLCCKDANEALRLNRIAFIKAVMEAEKAEENMREELKQQYQTKSAKFHIQAFLDGIKESVNTTFTPTGFIKLDQILDGGLYEGLYFLGAISSLGKTTYIQQITDNIAKSGKDVMVFTLEMARSELMAKSISRHTLNIAVSSKTSTTLAKTSRGITTGSRYARYSQDEKNLIKQAIEEYASYADHIFIEEGMGEVGTRQVREAVEEHYKVTGNRPIVVIDYLQILAPHDPRMTEKQNTDKAVMELKRISRDFKTPVIAISSFNRANYKSKVTMEAFKESGAIEYSCDVLIGLQLQGAGERDFDENQEKLKNPREIELVVLKNRNGTTGATIGYKYYPMFNYFVEQ